MITLKNDLICHWSFSLLLITWWKTNQCVTLLLDVTKLAIIIAHRPSFSSIAFEILAKIVCKTRAMSKALIFNSKSSCFNWWTQIETWRSLPFFLNHQRKRLVYRRSRFHHENLSSHLRISIIQSIEKLHQWILMLKRIDLIIYTIGALATGTARQRSEIQQLIPRSLKPCEVGGDCWISLHHSRNLLLQLWNLWSISLRETILEYIPNFKSCVPIDHTSSDMRRDTILNLRGNHWIALRPCLLLQRSNCHWSSDWSINKT